MSEEKKKKTKKKKEEPIVEEETKFATEAVEDFAENKIVDKVEHPVESESAIKETEETHIEQEESVSLESIIEETIAEEINGTMKDDVEEKPFRVNPIFTAEEKLYITKLVANGYRPFDIVKKARATLKLNEEKQKRLSLNIRTIEQLMKALEI